jgi:preprotein translocase subunit SecF
MRLFKTPNIDFVSKIKLAYTISATFLILTVVSLFYNPMRSGMGLNFSIDFVGGTVVQLKFEKAVMQDLGKIRGIVNNLGYGSAEVKRIGTAADNELQIIVRQKASSDADAGQVITNALNKDYPGNPFTMRRSEHVGPRIGKELQKQAIIAWHRWSRCSMTCW